MFKHAASCCQWNKYEEDHNFKRSFLFLPDSVAFAVVKVVCNVAVCDVAVFDVAVCDVAVCDAAVCYVAVFDVAVCDIAVCDVPAVVSLGCCI